MKIEGCGGLLIETIKIQKRFFQQRKPQKTEVTAKAFAKLVLEGKVNAEVQHLGDFWLLLANVIKTLRQKYPGAKPSSDAMMLHGLSII